MNAHAVSAKPVSESTSGPSPMVACGLRKSYAARSVLDGIDLELPRGSVLGLLGRNGAGKTTLLNALLGLTSLDAGTVQVLGEPVQALSDATKERLAYVMQQPAGFGWMRVDQWLALMAGSYPRWDAMRADHLLSRWQLDIHAPMAQLSPGERQRLELVRALAIHAELLVLDEPASSLDPAARRDLLRDLAFEALDEGTSVILSSHLVGDLERIAGQVALLHRGRLLLRGELDTIKENHARVQLPAAAEALPGEISRRRLESGGVSVVIARAPGQPWPTQLTAWHAQPQPLGLEDLFVEVTS
ncbi:MAG TPA: ABC transporter ATP-binding protein [Rhodanobacteraceae bacterium]